MGLTVSSSPFRADYMARDCIYLGYFATKNKELLYKSFTHRLQILVANMIGC